jgi:hypothetical protein
MAEKSAIGIPAICQVKQAPETGKDDAVRLALSCAELPEAELSHPAPVVRLAKFVAVAAGADLNPTCPALEPEHCI